MRRTPFQQLTAILCIALTIFNGCAGPPPSTFTNSIQTQNTSLSCWQKFNEYQYEAGSSGPTGTQYSNMHLFASLSSGSAQTMNRYSLSTTTARGTGYNVNGYGHATLSQVTVQSQTITLNERGQTVNGQTDWTSVSLKENGYVTLTYYSYTYSTFTQQQGANSYDSTTLNASGNGQYQFRLTGSDTPVTGGGFNLGSYLYTYSYSSNGSYSRHQVGSAVVPRSNGTPNAYPYDHTDNWGESISLGEVASVTPNGGTVLSYGSIQSTTDALTDDVNGYTASSITSNSLQGSGSLWTQQSSAQVNSSIYGFTPVSSTGSNTYTAALPSGYPPSPYLLMPAALSNSPAPAALELGSVVPSLYAIGQELPTGTLPGLSTRTPLPAPLPMYVAGPVLAFTPPAAYGNWLGQQYGSSPNWIGMQWGVAQVMSLNSMILPFLAFSAPTDAINNGAAQRPNPTILYAIGTTPPSVSQVYTGAYTSIRNSQAQSTAELGLRALSEDGESIYATIARETGLSYLAAMYVANSAEGARIDRMYQEDGYRPSIGDMAPAFANAMADAGIGIYQVAVGSTLTILSGGSLTTVIMGAMGAVAFDFAGHLASNADNGTQTPYTWAQAGQAVSGGVLIGGLMAVPGLGTAVIGYMGVEGALSAAQSFKDGQTWTGVVQTVGAALAFASVGIEIANAAGLNYIGGTVGNFLDSNFGEFLCEVMDGACLEINSPTLVGLKASERMGAVRDYQTYGNACDRVPTRNEADPNGPLVLRRVLRKHVGYALLIPITVNGHIIEITPNHTLYVLMRSDGDSIRELGWTNAGLLRPGDILATDNDERAMVEAVDHRGRWAKVCNLEVEDCHTYFVGGADWGFAVWAHNVECGMQNEATRDAARASAHSGQTC